VSQESLVQALSSLQVMASPVQVPPEHASFSVQTLPSSQALVFGAKTHPVSGSQESSVQPLSSLQVTAPPGEQVPAEQVSPVVQALPSSQEAVLLVCTHPVPELHESLVQSLSSLQSSAEPPAQEPAEQASPVVQALPSSQEAVLLLNTQPSSSSQESLVHSLSSLQVMVSPPHVPSEQTSFSLQALSSSQETVLSSWTQPLSGSQESVVHTLLSSQSSAAPPTHSLSWQVSFSVQALPSSQVSPSLSRATHGSTVTALS
jgi:hypothetical protein